MEVLMYGWEFPPNISGGLGMACYGIVSGLAKKGIKVSFVLPCSVEEKASCHENVSVVNCNSSLQDNSPQDFLLKQFGDVVSLHKIDALLRPYMDEKSYSQLFRDSCLKDVVSRLFSGRLTDQYGSDLFAEVFRYSLIAGSLADKIPHDVIHAHDWLTVLAGVEAKRLSGKPLVFHVHALEPDRIGEHVNQRVYEIEKYGMENADRIVAVSQYTKNIIVKHYGIDPEKISVVHNGGIYDSVEIPPPNSIPDRSKMVLFLGRITYQKGPWFFIEIANKILSKRKDVQFVIAGSGDLLRDAIEYTASLRIGRNVHFTGFLDQELVKRLYGLADVYVMPSVSEPFGLSCLEALSHDVPAVISKQSGVSEVLSHVLRADFWDVDDMSAKILALLDYKPLREEIIKNTKEEIKSLTWDNTANKLMTLYEELR